MPKMAGQRDGVWSCESDICSGRLIGNEVFTLTYNLENFSHYDERCGKPNQGGKQGNYFKRL